MPRMPTVTCANCGRSFSALKADCPYCGQRRVIGGDRPTRPDAPPPRRAPQPRQPQRPQPQPQRQQPPRQQTPQRQQPQRQPHQRQQPRRGRQERGRVGARSGWQVLAGLLLIAAGALAVLLMALSARSDGQGFLLRPTPTPTPVYTKAPRPTPSPSPTPKCENIRLFYINAELTAEAGGFTMYPGDLPLTLTAKAYPIDKLVDARLTWSVSDPSKARLTPSADTMSCEIEALESAGGRITLSVSCYGFTLEMPFYIWLRG